MFKEKILKLIKEVSTNIPYDIKDALLQAFNAKPLNKREQFIIDVILQNIGLAKEKSSPICQDTGFPTFYVKCNENFNQKTKLKNDIIKAVRESTAKGYLRPNAVDAIYGKNSGDNTGIDFPKIYFEDSESDNIEISLLLKGGGSENVSDQVSLPADLGKFGKAGRDLEGVKKAVLYVIEKAKGNGCPPGIIGVHIGGDRLLGYYNAKKNLLRQIGITNSIKELGELENEIIIEANKLGVGAMGLGGNTTILDCIISASHRVPASFFITISYMCWACRRGFITMDKEGKLLNGSNDNLNLNYHSVPDTESKSFFNIKKIRFPIVSGSEISDLKVGDIVSISGTIFTGRDSLHSYAMKNNLDKDLKGSAIYHCGPVALKDEKGEWYFNACGPTTSTREEPYEADFIEKTGIKAVIGKGGMGEKTKDALKKFNAVYLHAIGGAAVFYANTIRKVKDVSYLEFGIPEAMWEIEVQDFLAIVSMDSHGNSMH